MSAFKKLNRQDVYVNSYTARKQFRVTGSFPTNFSVRSLSTVSASRSEEYWSSINHLYYNDIFSGSYYSGSREHYLQSSLISSSRLLSDSAFIVSLEQNLAGTHIEPGTFEIDKYYSGSGYTYFTDDGEGRITSGGVYVGDIIYPHGIAILTDQENVSKFTLPADLSNIAAAYSLRKVSSNYDGPILRVRRSGDDKEADVYPDSHGELSNLSPIIQVEEFPDVSNTNPVLEYFVGKRNFFEYSEDFTGWSFISAALTKNSITGPFGGNSGSFLESTSGAATEIFYEVTGPFVSGSDYTFSVYARQANYHEFELRAVSYLSTFNNESVTFNLKNGSITSTANGGIGNVENVGNGWYRCSLTAQARNTSNGEFRITLTTDTTGEGIYIFGASVNQSSTPVVYTRTVGAIGGDGYVTKWYDQSGFNRHASQTDSTKQGAFYISGSILELNNRPRLDFDGTDDYYEINDFAYRKTAQSIITVAKPTLSAANKVIFAHDNTSDRAFAQYISNANNFSFIVSSDGTTTKIATSGSILSEQTMYTSVFNGTELANDELKLLINSEYIISASTSTELDESFDSTSVLTIGRSLAVASSFFKGSIQEINFYDTDISSSFSSYYKPVDNYYYLNQTAPDYTSSFYRWKSNQPILIGNYTAKVKDYEFNQTQNPSVVVSGSDNLLQGFATASYFNPYITTVGLYNDASELIAVAKLGTPVPKSPDTDMTFVIKLDY